MPGDRSKQLKKLRLAVGVGLLILSVVPWIIAAIVPFLGSSAGSMAASIGGLLVTAEVIGAIAVVVLGREAYATLRARFRREKRLASDDPTAPARVDPEA